MQFERYKVTLELVVGVERPELVIQAAADLQETRWPDDPAFRQTYQPTSDDWREVVALALQSLLLDSEDLDALLPSGLAGATRRELSVSRGGILVEPAPDAYR